MLYASARAVVSARQMPPRSSVTLLRPPHEYVITTNPKIIKLDACLNNYVQFPGFTFALMLHLKSPTLNVHLTHSMSVEYMYERVCVSGAHDHVQPYDVDRSNIDASNVSIKNRLVLSRASSHQTSHRTKGSHSARVPAGMI